MSAHQFEQAIKGKAVDGDHTHDYRSAGRRGLILVLGLVCLQIVIETVGGILSGSLGLLAHATHVVTDAVTICLALFAMWMAEKPASITRTFGFHRIEVLVVMLNAVALCALAGWIFYGAYQRFSGLAAGHEHEINSPIMLVVAVVALGISVMSAWTLFRSHRHSINVEGAFWHVVADLAGSVAVVVSSIVLVIYDWDLIDPILSVLIGLLVVSSAFRLGRKVVRILLELTPPGLDLYKLCSRIEDSEGVTLVHDVHAWTITTSYNALSVHVLVDPGYQGDVEQLMRRLQQTIHEEFDIQHITMQMERSATDCFEHHHVDHLEARSQLEL